ncbi:MAG TPA: DUF4147 domain-containing protein [Candidatus Saccharimonadales bacterium]|nr:DUF4147 domain-containing protein [Candidatus Saccharimonadales bacterium]
MAYIQNLPDLSTSPKRQLALTLIDTAFQSIQPTKVMETRFHLEGDTLSLQDEKFPLSSYKRIFVIAFGKGSAGIAQFVEKTLGQKITDGYVIDTVEQQFEKLHFTLGTHPVPSIQNINFTNTVLENIKNLSENDLVLVIICGGGSALFESSTVSLEQIEAINSELLKSGATISEMNAIRKHVSKVKGGKLAEHLYPAKIVSLIFSDVPGNDLTVIASGPTVKNNASKEDAMAVMRKYGLQTVTENDLVDSPSEEKYFQHVSNIIMVSNMTAISAMKEKARSLGWRVTVLTDRLQGDAKKIGKVLLSETRSKEILLAGGETTVHVTGTGRGGRNQTLVLASLPFLDATTLIASFDSDGWDFAEFAGALGDMQTLKKTEEMGLDVKEFLDNDNSTEFFEKVGDGILTGKLESNVSDIFLVIRD